MRISDWSSDVCSSDLDDYDVLQRLHAVDLDQQLRDDRALHVGADAGAAGAEHGVHLVEEDDDRPALLRLLPGPLEHEADLALGLAHVLVEQLRALDVEEVRAGRVGAGRSEEHTSELQSLMRISYAVFCLKK